MVSSLALFDTCWVSLAFFSDAEIRSRISSEMETGACTACSSYLIGVITASGIGRSSWLS